MEIGEGISEEESDKPIVQPQHVALTSHSVEGVIVTSGLNKISSIKRSQTEHGNVEAMVLSHPNLLSCHANSSVMSEPPLKRSKLDLSSTINKNLASNNILSFSKIETAGSLAPVSPEIGSFSCSGPGTVSSSVVDKIQSTSQVAQNDERNPALTKSYNSAPQAPVVTTNISNAESQNYSVFPIAAASESGVPTASGSRLSVTTHVSTDIPSKLEASTSGSTANSDLTATSAVVSNVRESGVHGKHDEQITAPTEETTSLKSTSFLHLSKKYLGELEYMLREFQKLERQLLGAKTQNTVESAGSKERREKLHSFILHLEETIQQIIAGCQSEIEGKSTLSESQGTGSPLPKDWSKEKAEEDSVQKLEEHILANLLPVKVRLKRQLAAQQGAKNNPAGMPAVRGGMQPLASGAKQPKATFLRAAPPPERRPSQFGQPLEGGGSSLTQKLHGQTLGSSSRIHGHGVGQTMSEASADVHDTATAKSNSGKEESLSVNEKPKILYAGMALGSNQIQSSVSAAGTVHKLVIQDPALLESAAQNKVLSLAAVEVSQGQTPMTADNLSCGWSSASSAVHGDSDAKAAPQVVTLSVPPSIPDKNEYHENIAAEKPSQHTQATEQVVQHEQQTVITSRDEQSVLITNPAEDINESCGLTPAARDAILSYEERRKQKKRRKRKKKQGEQQKSQTVQGPNQQTETLVNKRSKKTHSQRGPRNVEYICALCNEIYNSTCDYNPWWALTQHDCPKCHKMQIPRIDISAAANAIEYHPALLAHADENGGGVTPAAVMFLPPKVALSTTSSDSESDLSDDDGILSDGEDSLYFSDSEPDDVVSMTVADKVENEKFGLEYDGPKLSDSQASRLLILMLHASTCPGFHRAENHNDVCRSTKWMMLHVRDCPGTTVTCDVCPFPWCRKVKHLLYHLVSCENPPSCQICSPTNIGLNMKRLRALNEFRLQTRCRSVPLTTTSVPQEKKDSSTAPLAEAFVTDEPRGSQTADSKNTIQIEFLDNRISAMSLPIPANDGRSVEGQARIDYKAADLAHSVKNEVSYDTRIETSVTLLEPNRPPLQAGSTAALLGLVKIKQEDKEEPVGAVGHTLTLSGTTTAITTKQENLLSTISETTGIGESVTEACSGTESLADASVRKTLTGTSITLPHPNRFLNQVGLPVTSNNLVNLKQEDEVETGSVQGHLLGAITTATGSCTEISSINFEQTALGVSIIKQENGHSTIFETTGIGEPGASVITESVVGPRHVSIANIAASVSEAATTSADIPNPSSFVHADFAGSIPSVIHTLPPVDAPSSVATLHGTEATAIFDSKISADMRNMNTHQPEARTAAPGTRNLLDSANEGTTTTQLYTHQAPSKNSQKGCYHDGESATVIKSVQLEQTESRDQGNCTLLFSTSAGTLNQCNGAPATENESHSGFLPGLCEETSTMPSSFSNPDGIATNADATTSTVLEAGDAQEDRTNAASNFCASNPDEKVSLLECKSEPSRVQKDQVSKENLVEPLQVQ